MDKQMQQSCSEKVDTAEHAHLTISCGLPGSAMQQEATHSSRSGHPMMSTGAWTSKGVGWMRSVHAKGLGLGSAVLAIATVLR